MLRQLYAQEFSIVKAPILLPPSSSVHFSRVLKDFERLNMKICSIRLFPQLEDSQGKYAVFRKTGTSLQVSGKSLILKRSEAEIEF